MLSGAPPMFVVGVLVQVAVLVIEFFVGFVFDWSFYGPMYTALLVASQLVTLVMVGTGALELARRTRGRQRVAMGVAAAAQFVLFAALITFVGISMRMRLNIGYADFDRDWYEVVMRVQKWLLPSLSILTVAGLAAAGDRRGLFVGAFAVAVTLFVSPLPPLMDKVFGFYRGAGWLGWLGFFGMQVVLEIILAARIAKRALAPRRDHVRAARGFAIAIVGVALHALFWLAMIAWSEFGAERYVIGSLAICGLDVLALIVVVRGAWLVAQAQHPSLPRYMVHVALACALATLFGLGHVVQEWYALYYGRGAIVPPWWIELGATLTLGWLFIVLGLYARRMREIAPPVVLCAGAFTLFACVGVALHDDEVVTAVCLLLANLAAIPAFRAARRAIAADPVKTTADVFA